VPLYLHPTSPSAGLIQTVAATWARRARSNGFGVDTGMHLLSIITSGAFRSLPETQKSSWTPGRGAAVLGCFSSTTCTARRSIRSAMRFMKPLQRRISEYLKENSLRDFERHAWAPAIQFCQQVLGAIG